MHTATGRAAAERAGGIRPLWVRLGRQIPGSARSGPARNDSYCHSSSRRAIAVRSRSTKRNRPHTTHSRTKGFSSSMRRCSTTTDDGRGAYRRYPREREATVPPADSCVLHPSSFLHLFVCSFVPADDTSLPTATVEKLTC